MQKQIIGFLGAGNMGQSLIKGLIVNGYQASTLWACDHNIDNLSNLSKSYPTLHTTCDSIELVEQSNVIVLAVKPQGLENALSTIKARLAQKKPLLISIAAGIELERIKLWLAPLSLDIIRAMPNTPALLQVGVTGLYAPKALPLPYKQLVQSLFQSVGETVWIEEEALMDVVTALSGSGPAYFFYILDAFIKGAHELGLPLKIAQLLITHTMLGASKMALNSGDLTVLRQQVTSKGGTTEAGLKALDKGQLATLLAQALKAATHRAKELNLLSDSN